MGINEATSMANEPHTTKHPGQTQASKPQSEPAPPILMTENHVKVAGTAGDKTQGAAKRAEIAPSAPSRIHQILIWFRNKASAAHLADWAMVFFTFIIAASTIAYTIYAKKQWKAISGQLSEMQKQNDLTREQLVGTMSAAVVFQEPRLTSDPVTQETILLIGLVNQGHVIAPEAHTRFEINTVSFPEQTTTIESETDTVAFQQLAIGGGNSKEYKLRDFPQSNRKFVTQRKTITIKGIFGFDNGFGDKFEQPICYSYIGAFSFKNEGAGSTSGGDGFYPCDRLNQLVPYILKHPMN